MTSSNHPSRRTFLQVALGTISTAALPGGVLARLWPASQLDREVDEPWVLALAGEVLWDPATDDQPRRVPTLREYLEDFYPGSETGSDCDDFVTWYMSEELGLCVDDDEGEEWDSARDDALESLSEGLDPCGSYFEQWIEKDSNSEAWTTWMELPEEVRERFEVDLIEGDCPGYNRTYIRYAGELEALNRDLAAAGLNVVVIAQEPSYEMLFPGDPGY